MLIKGLGAVIPGGISVQDFCTIANTDKTIAKKILNDFVKNDIGRFEDDVINFDSADKLKAAIYAIKNGATIDEVAVHLNWRDFEGLVAKIFEAKGFSVLKNLILTKPRMEIDVVGVRLGMAILVDCKHWKRHSPSTLKNTVTKQIQRVRHYVKKTSGAMAIPVIVTLYQEQFCFIEKVPIVPILQFSSFVDELYGNLDQVNVIETA
ncbi:MAG: restriction endonuclease [Thaumarchaeota archaeon]|nr:restriction endonuclease [Nitrososphaerota archaeon]